MIYKCKECGYIAGPKENFILNADLCKIHLCPATSNYILLYNYNYYPFVPAIIETIKDIINE